MSQHLKKLNRKFCKRCTNLVIREESQESKGIVIGNWITISGRENSNAVISITVEMCRNCFHWWQHLLQSVKIMIWYFSPPIQLRAFKHEHNCIWFGVWTRGSKLDNSTHTSLPGFVFFQVLWPLQTDLNPDCWNAIIKYTNNFQTT